MPFFPNPPCPDPRLQHLRSPHASLLTSASLSFPLMQLVLALLEPEMPLAYISAAMALLTQLLSHAPLSAEASAALTSRLAALTAAAPRPSAVLKPLATLALLWRHAFVHLAPAAARTLPTLLIVAAVGEPASTATAALATSATVLSALATAAARLVTSFIKLSEQHDASVLMPHVLLSLHTALPLADGDAAKMLRAPRLHSPDGLAALANALYTLACHRHVLMHPLEGGGHTKGGGCKTKAVGVGDSTASWMASLLSLDVQRAMPEASLPCIAAAPAATRLFALQSLFLFAVSKTTKAEIEQFERTEAANERASIAAYLVGAAPLSAALMDSQQITRRLLLPPPAAADDDCDACAVDRAVAALAAQLARPLPPSDLGSRAALAAARLRARALAAAVALPAATAATSSPATIDASGVAAPPPPWRLLLLSWWLEALFYPRHCDITTSAALGAAAAALRLPFLQAGLRPMRSTEKSCESKVTSTSHGAAVLSLAKALRAGVHSAGVPGAMGSAIADISAITAAPAAPAALVLCAILSSPMSPHSQMAPALLLLQGHLSFRPQPASAAAVDPEPAEPDALDRLATALAAALSAALRALSNAPPRLRDATCHITLTASATAIDAGAVAKATTVQAACEESEEVDAAEGRWAEYAAGLLSQDGNRSRGADMAAAAFLEREAAMVAWRGGLSTVIRSACPHSAATTALAALALSTPGSLANGAAALSALCTRHSHAAVLAALTEQWLPPSVAWPLSPAARGYCALAAAQAAGATAAVTNVRRRRIHALQLTCLYFDILACASTPPLRATAASAARVAVIGRLLPLLMAVAFETDALLAGAAIASLTTLTALAGIVTYFPSVFIEATSADTNLAPSLSSAAAVAPNAKSSTHPAARSMSRVAALEADGLGAALVVGRKADLALQKCAVGASSGWMRRDDAPTASAKCESGLAMEMVTAKRAFLCGMLRIEPTGLPASVTLATLAALPVTHASALDPSMPPSSPLALFPALIAHLAEHAAAALAALNPTNRDPHRSRKASLSSSAAAAAAGSSCAVLRGVLFLRRQSLETATVAAKTAQAVMVGVACDAAMAPAIAVVRASIMRSASYKADADLKREVAECIALILEALRWLPLSTVPAVPDAAATAAPLVTSPPLLAACLSALSLFESAEAAPIACLALPLGAAAALRPAVVAKLAPAHQLDIFRTYLAALRWRPYILFPRSAAAHTGATAVAKYVAGLRLAAASLPVCARDIVQRLLDRTKEFDVRGDGEHESRYRGGESVDGSVSSPAAVVGLAEMNASAWVDECMLTIELLASRAATEASALVPQLLALLAFAANYWPGAAAAPYVVAASVPATTAILASLARLSGKFGALVSLTMAVLCQALADVATAAAAAVDQGATAIDTTPTVAATATATTMSTSSSVRATAMVEALSERASLLVACLAAADREGRTRLASDILSLVRLMGLVLPAATLTALLPAPSARLAEAAPAAEATMTATIGIAPCVVAVLLPALLRRPSVLPDAVFQRISALLLGLKGEGQAALLLATVDGISAAPAVSQYAVATSPLASLLRHFLVTDNNVDGTPYGTNFPAVTCAPPVTAVAMASSPFSTNAARLSQTATRPSFHAARVGLALAHATKVLKNGECCRVALAILTAAPPSACLYAMAGLLVPPCTSPAAMTSPGGKATAPPAPSLTAASPPSLTATSRTPTWCDPTHLLRYVFVCGCLAPEAALLPSAAPARAEAAASSGAAATSDAAIPRRAAAAAAAVPTATATSAAAIALFGTLAASAEALLTCVEAVHADEARATDCASTTAAPPAAAATIAPSAAYSHLLGRAQASLAAVVQMATGVAGVALLEPIGSMLQHSHRAMRRMAVSLLLVQLGMLLPDVDSAAQLTDGAGTEDAALAQRTTAPMAAVPHLLSLVALLRPLLVPDAASVNTAVEEELSVLIESGHSSAAPAAPALVDGPTSKAALLSMDLLARTLGATESAAFIDSVPPALASLRCADANVAHAATLLLSTLISALGSRLLALLPSLVPALLDSLESFFAPSRFPLATTVSLATSMLSSTYPALLTAFPELLGPFLAPLLARLVTIGSATNASAGGSETTVARLAAIDAPALLVARTSLLRAIATAVPSRVLLKAMAEALPLLTPLPSPPGAPTDSRGGGCGSGWCGFGSVPAPAALVAFFDLLGDHLSLQSPSDVSAYRAASFSLLQSALAYREKWAVATTSDDAGAIAGAMAGAAAVEAAAGRALVNLTTALNEEQLRLLFHRTLAWALELYPTAAGAACDAVGARASASAAARAAAFFGLIAPSQARFAALYVPYVADAIPLALATLAAHHPVHGMLATASPAAAATAYAATAAASSAKRRKLLSTAETAAASEAEKLAAGAWLAIHRALHFLVASLPFHRRFSATSADHLLKLQPLLCNVLGAASIAAVYAGPTITVSAAVTAADTLAHTAAAAEVAKAAVAAIGSLAREMGADGVKVMHHQLCTRAQLEEITTYTTKPAATTIIGGAAADITAAAAATNARAHALCALAAIYDALGDSAFQLSAEALPVASEAMEDADTTIRQAALGLMHALESLPKLSS